ncbi:MAG: hypothetical protein V9G04_08845 [Nocardioides sp.]|jgi:hypothetical protein
MSGSPGQAGRAQQAKPVKVEQHSQLDHIRTTTVKNPWDTRGRLNDIFTNRYDPWVHLGLREPFRGVRVRFNSDLEKGRALGLAEWGSPAVIHLLDSMDSGQIRATLAHEIVHLERGAVPRKCGELEDAICDLVAASRLIDVEKLSGLRKLVDGAGEDLGALAAGLGVDIDTSKSALILLDAAEARVTQRRQASRVTLDA